MEQMAGTSHGRPTVQSFAPFPSGPTVGAMSFSERGVIESPRLNMSPTRIRALDGLRALAVSLVVIDHSFANFQGGWNRCRRLLRAFRFPDYRHPPQGTRNFRANQSKALLPPTRFEALPGASDNVTDYRHLWRK